MSKTIHSVEVQILPPKHDFPGQTVQGMYIVEDGTVTLVDHHGNPVRGSDGKAYSKKLTPGEDARLIAGRMAKEFRKDRRGKTVAGFDAPIQYPPSPNGCDFQKRKIKHGSL